MPNRWRVPPKRGGASSTSGTTDECGVRRSSSLGRERHRSQDPRIERPVVGRYELRFEDMRSECNGGNGLFQASQEGDGPPIELEMDVSLIRLQVGTHLLGDPAPLEVQPDGDAASLDR